MGINSTYFFRIHANEYNCLSYEVISLIKTISDMGHEIGLHAEPLDIYKATGFDPHLSMTLGKKILESIIDKKITGIACHNDPTPDNNLDFFKDNSPADYEFEYEAYDNKLNLFLNSCYVTDSHPWYWRTFIDGEITKENGCICKIFEQERPLVYCLTHPHMWYYRHFHLVKY